ncbi:MAG: alcohol dehydrogenase catalytic domain-containing protein [Bacteroidota bacterium]
MKAMMLTGIRQMEMMEVPDPVIGGLKDVKIKMTVVGVCGSDIHYYTKGKIGSQVVNYPFTVGHEGAGIVVETGTSVKRVKPGDVVAIEPAISCHECDQCLAGRTHTCRKLRFLGCPGQAEGCLSEFIVMPEECCFPLPEGLIADHGSLSEPLSIGIYSLTHAGDLENTLIAILGFGPIGLSVYLAAMANGAQNIFVTDKIDERLKIAVREGAAYTGNPLKEKITEQIKLKVPLGLDIVFECCGQQEALDQAVEMLKPGGRLIIVGIPETEKWTLSVDDTRRKEISVFFVRREADCVGKALELMLSGKINADNMITHRFPFKKTREAFDLVAAYADGIMKAMIYI